MAIERRSSKAVTKPAVDYYEWTFAWHRRVLEEFSGPGKWRRAIGEEAYSPMSLAAGLTAVTGREYSSRAVRNAARARGVLLDERRVGLGFERRYWIVRSNLGAVVDALDAAVRPDEVEHAARSYIGDEAVLIGRFFQ
jgi:hypothetical protein